MGDRTTPNDETRQFEQSDSQAEHRPDRMPTDQEAQLADREDLDPEVAESYDEANERGASQKGEGRIS